MAALMSTMLATVFVASAGNVFAQRIADGGFESGAYIVGSRPTAPGIWQGDLNAKVGAENAIVPRRGERMMRFIHTTPGGPSESAGAELWQIVDLREYADLIATGRVIASFSVSCNRVAGNAATDTQFVAGIGAYAGECSSFPSQWQRTELIYGDNAITTDDDPLTWERLRVNVVLPVDTEFIAVHLRAHEDVWNDLIGLEFHGHYADDALLRYYRLPR